MAVDEMEGVVKEKEERETISTTVSGTYPAATVLYLCVSAMRRS
jgi:hypothetical protein